MNLIDDEKMKASHFIAEVRAALFDLVPHPE
jgi:hypothetical protein